MSILNRMRQIFSANANAALDKMEDPEKMIEQYIREAETALGEVKARTADSMVVKDRCDKKLNTCKEQIASMTSYASKALKEGNETDAEKFIEKRMLLEEELDGLTLAAESAAVNVAQMRELHDKLAKELDSYKNKRDSIRSKMAVVKTSEKVAEMTNLAGKAGATLSNFSRMEEKVDNLLSRQNAMAQLDKPSDEIADLKNKYDVPEHEAKVKAEIEKLKEELKKAV